MKAKTAEVEVDDLLDAADKNTPDCSGYRSVSVGSSKKRGNC